MNQSNPIVDSREEQQKEQYRKEIQKTYYPVKVCCVVWNLTDANNDAQIKMIKDHAHKSNAHFITRMYDSSKYSDDRYEIKHLPAFHIYIKSSYNRTFYPNTRPLQHIDECIEAYILHVEQKKERRRRWSMLYNSFVSWLRRMSHRETRMERYERENKKDIVDTSRFRNMKMNSVGISEWN